MDNNIVITKSEVDSIVADLQAEKDKISGYVRTLANEVSYINNAWKGVDATLYMSKMNDDYGVLLSDFNKCLQTYITYLEKVYSEYEKLDNTYASKTIGV